MMPGDHREHQETDEDLAHRDHMAVQGLRVHVPVAHGRQRLDAEEKRAEETGRVQIGDASGHGIVKAAEDQIEDQEEGDDGGE